MPALAEYYAQLGVHGMSGIMGAFGRVKAGLTGLASAGMSPIRGLSGMLGGLVSPAGMVSAALGAAGVAGVGGIMKLAAETESLGTQFKVLLGSGEAAAAMIADVNKFAAETPYEQMELGNAAKQLLAYGMAQGQIIPTMRRLGDISALSGTRLEDLVGIYGKVRGQGKLTAETLEQFQVRGIPITAELAKQFGVAETEVRGLVSTGKIGFAQVDAAITALTSNGGKFAGGMAQLAQTTGGLWSTVTGNLKTLLAQFGGVVIKVFNVKGILAGLGTWLDKMSGVFETWGASVSARIEGFWSKWGGLIKQYAATWWATMKASAEVVWSVMQSIWGVVSSVFKSITSVVSGFFGGTSRDLKAMAIDWLKSIQFVAENWRLHLDILWERFKLFCTNIPAYFSAAAMNLVQLVQWFGRNWQDIFVSIWRFGTTTFGNLVTNLRNLWDSFLTWIKGGGWEFNWKPLTEGFKSAIREMPQFVAAGVRASTPELDRMMEELEKRRREFYGRGKKAAESPAGSPGAGGGTPGASPAIAAAGGKSGVSFTGLAALANQMQEEAGKRLQENMAKAGQKTADATGKLAGAVAGNRLRVEVINPTSPVAAFAK